MKTYKFLISGKVQGVSYRAYVSENARRAGFKGYVKNLPNGKVEAVANIKDDEDLTKFLFILEKGSPSSDVKNINIEELPYIDFKDFSIKY